MRRDRSSLRRALRLLWEADRARALVYLVLTVVGGVLPPVAAVLLKQTLDRAGAALLQPGDAALASGAFAAAGWYVGARFIGRLLQPVAEQVKGNLDAQVTGYVEQRMMAVGGAIPDLDHFERKEFRDELALLRTEVSWRPKNLTVDLQLVLRSLLTLTGSLVLLWRFQPLLALALCATAVPQALLQRRLLERTYSAMTARSEKARMMAYCAVTTTEPRSAKELLVFGVGPWFYQRWRRLASEALAEMARLRGVALRASLGVVGANGLALALSFAYVAAQVGAHRLTIGDFALYLSVIAGLQQTLFGLTRGAGNLDENLRFLARLFAFLDETEPSIAVARAGNGVPAPKRIRHGLELRHVAFRYPGGSAPVLSDVSCMLAAGEVVALVGENGAGKTTLVKLLTRLYDPTAGEVLLDGVPLAAYDLAGLRRRITTLFQDFAHFALSAQHNIGVGDVRFADDRERVLAVAARTGADTVLEKLPQGLDTPLTRQFAGGVDLSGGEWQKVATARAAMRDAALVILDEPTAALDAQAEAELFQRFRQLAAGRTVLLISHRFSTVRMADRILVLEDGRIVENGTHDDLTARGGRYAALYELQAARYR